MIRHEQQLSVQTEPVATERVRLQKFIVSEERTVTFTVRHEEVRMVREPLDGDVVSPSLLGEQEAPRVMILSEERLVVTTETVPVERVWLQKHTITEHQEIHDTIEHEEIEVYRSDR